jgi:Zinc carboxypeptidase
MTLYISDSTSDKLYAIAPDALTAYDGVCGTRATGTTYNLTDLTPDTTSPWGVTHDGTNFYLIDSVTLKLHKFTISGANLVQSAAWDLTLTPRPIDLPRGLAFDGTYVNLADANTNLIYKLSTADGSVVDAVDPYDNWGASDMDPTGITFIDGDMWLTDEETGIKKLFNNTSYYRDLDSFEYFSKGNTSFETPSYNPKGLVYDGTFFWVVDDYNNRLYKINASTGVTVSSCQTPWSRPNGLAYNGGSLYISDNNSDLIYVVNPATCAVTSSYAAPSTGSRGLVHDGTNLWATDSDSDLVYKIDPATGVVASSFATPASTPRGLAWDGTYLWLADEGTDLYYQINSATGATVKTRTVIELSAEGITFKDGQLWSVDDVQDRMYNVDSTLLAQGQFATPSGSAQGFTYSGSNIWATDSGTDSFYKLNASTGAIVNTYAAPANDPRDITWDGANLWLTTDADNRIYKINPADGSTITSFAAPASDPIGIVYAGGNLYVSDPITNKIYQVDPADGSNDANFNAPGSASGSMAYDGTSVWIHDTDERMLYKLVFDDDDDEGIVEATQDVYSTAIQGIEFIDGTLWTVDSYFDMFFDDDLTASEPDAVIAIANAYTVPYAVSDSFYFTTRNSSEAFYIQRRLLNVPETSTRKILASSSRGGALYVREERTNGGNIFSLDLGLLGDNFEISRQTVPAVTLFFNALGIQVHANGDHEETRPTYASLNTDLATLMTDCSAAFTRTQIGTSSNSQPIYSYAYGTVGKPIALYLSGTHGNEEHGYVPEVRFMQDLCTDFLTSDARALNMYVNYRTIFVPLLNPYGIANLSRYNANNVDLNRNYDYAWSAFPSSHKGSSAFSESETQAIRDVVNANLANIVFVNDAHSAMAISPGMTWGCALGESAPTFIADIYDIFTSQNAKRWFETNVAVTRWMTYDRYTFQDCATPYFGNWVAALGVPTSTNEVFGKKDVDTQRMIHTNAWYKSHFDATFDALSSKYARAVYRIDGTLSSAHFTGAVLANTTVPGGTSVTFKYGSNSTTAEPTTWYSTYSQPTNNRYLFVELVLARDAYDTSTPSVQDFTVEYSQTSAVDDIDIAPRKHSLADGTFSQDGVNEPESVAPGSTVQLSWQTEGSVEYVKIVATNHGERIAVAPLIRNQNIYTWTIPADLVGDVTVTVEATDLFSTTDTEEILVHVVGSPEVNEDSDTTTPVTSPVFGVTAGMTIRGTSSPTVYYIDDAYRRHPFIDEQTFLTWHQNFDAVHVVANDVLARFPLSVPMMPKVETVLVKIQSDPKVYEMVANPEDPFRPTLRWIPFESVAVSRYGEAWADYVIDVPVTSFGHFHFGESVSDGDAASRAAAIEHMRKRFELFVR